ncbi:hypothetical protein AGABI2DRAFT_122896 [Agaricus bisporus var. bisporus H97]|uniref:hypothetical protein n=1 Tax=Agaricus bisporus var. bisporus (strain H97 / ATCC MYA-4626 / FGSC 10389) TaxID=936046 RepID=UPI00029F7A8E|nr:hypothetical protein AGABI2DRAFT_122896 [Agaricus bisporus var. bisporus H97]EKV42167.1 hypothetical protein AGABI2DRAFT_122896 [Agaricus bisporus var. bisporus H97]
MSAEYCVSTLPNTPRSVRLSWIVGCILSCIGYGALVVVGHACYVGLRRCDSQSGSHSRVYNHKMLIIYVVFTLVLATATEVAEIFVTLDGILDDVCFFQGLQPPTPYLGLFAITVWLTNITTDGLFVWRCYTLCGGLRGQRGWSTLLWAMPLGVYIVMICTGTNIIIGFAAYNTREVISDVLLPLQYGISGFLNALVTICIIVLILRHRRATLEAFGENHQMPYLNVMTMLIESASLVVVIDIFAVAGYIQGILSNVAMQVWIPLQVS